VSPFFSIADIPRTRAIAGAHRGRELLAGPGSGVGLGALAVDLVDDEEERGLHALQRGFHLGAERLLVRHVHQVQHGVDVLHALQDVGEEDLVEAVCRRDEAGQVDEDDLAVVVRIDTGEALAGGLRERADGGKLGADEGIEERGLAGVRLPEERDEAGAEGLTHDGRDGA
jgi:hypothetical protein